MTRSTKPKRITILDVAKAAGVSHTTVSFIINEVPGAGIPEETRARVRQAIAALDYHPHDGARTLGRRSSQTLGIAIPEDNPHYQEIVAGIEQYAEQHGYSVLLAITHFDSAREQRCFQWLKQRKIDGLIIIPSLGDALASQLGQLTEQGYPITTLGVYDNRVDNVRPELETGERLLIDHLVALGHQRIGYIYGVAHPSVYSYRLETCLRLQRDHGLPVVAEWVRRCGPTVEDAYSATGDLLAHTAPGARPTALVVVNDLLASAVIAALGAAHLHVPADMSVAAFDNTRHGQFVVYPPLTSVDYAASRMGAQAAQTIIARLADTSQPPRSDIMPATLVVRGSTGPAPTD